MREGPGEREEKKEGERDVPVRLDDDGVFAAVGGDVYELAEGVHLKKERSEAKSIVRKGRATRRTRRNERTSIWFTAGGIENF